MKKEINRNGTRNTKLTVDASSVNLVLRLLWFVFLFLFSQKIKMAVTLLWHTIKVHAHILLVRVRYVKSQSNAHSTLQKKNRVYKNMSQKQRNFRAQLTTYVYIYVTSFTYYTYGGEFAA